MALEANMLQVKIRSIDIVACRKYQAITSNICFAHFEKQTKNPGPNPGTPLLPPLLPPPGNPPTASLPPPDQRLPASPPVKLRLLSCFTHSVQAANCFPATLLVIFDAVYGEGTATSPHTLYQSVSQSVSRLGCLPVMTL